MNPTVTFNDIARAVWALDRPPPGTVQELEATTRASFMTLSVAALGRAIHVDLGNGHVLTCHVQEKKP